MTETTAELLATIEGGTGRLRLNRPRAIHALNSAMIGLMTDALVAWRDDPAVRLVLIDHAEGRGFCAGGDVAAVARAVVAGDGALGDAFFREEYRLNHLMYTYPKTGVVFMDGITMGGGVGIAAPCRYRVATENTVLAMPETAIGLFPDVGGGRYLSRLQGRFGQYLGLTGTRLRGAECVALRLATHYVPSDRLADVKAQLSARPEDVEHILARASRPVGRADILADTLQINHCFASNRLEEIVEALEVHGTEWAEKTLATLRRVSPWSCKVTLRLLAESLRVKDFESQMRMEFALVHHVFRAPDFYEGVRAVLIDKDQTPRWSAVRAEDVADTAIDAAFAPLSLEEAWMPLGV